MPQLRIDKRLLVTGLWMVVGCARPALPPRVTSALGPLVQRPAEGTPSRWKGEILPGESNEVYWVEIVQPIPDTIEGVEIFRVFSTTAVATHAIVVTRTNDLHLLIDIGQRDPVRGLVIPSFCNGTHGIVLDNDHGAIAGICWRPERNRYDYERERPHHPH